MSKLIDRHGMPDIIWTANHIIADTVISILDKGSVHYPIIGGIDWNSETFLAISNDKMYTTLGGHFMDGAWAMVLINDNVNGYDITLNNDGVYANKLNVTTPKNIKNHQVWFNQRGWEQINFKAFSQQYNSIVEKQGYLFQLIL